MAHISATSPATCCGRTRLRDGHFDGLVGRVAVHADQEAADQFRCRERSTGCLKYVQRLRRPAPLGSPVGFFSSVCFASLSKLAKRLRISIGSAKALFARDPSATRKFVAPPTHGGARRKLHVLPAVANA